MSDTAPNGSAGSDRLGNTIPTGSNKRKRCNAAKNWVLTWNNYPEDWKAPLAPILEGSGVEYILGKEIGDEGTPHIQGYVEWPEKVRPLEKGMPKQIHWEVARKNRATNIKYCSKDNDYICTPALEPEAPLPTIELRGWQLPALEAIKAPPDNRSILWYYSKEGGCGKSTMVRYLAQYEGALICSGKASDMKLMVVKYKEKNGRYPKLVVFDVPRSSFKYLSYTGLEEIKNGVFASSKYETDMVIMPYPQVVVFCNFAPDWRNEDLSEDRLVVTNVGSE